MKVTLIYKHEAVTLAVPATLQHLHKKKVFSSADVVREMKKSYALHLSLQEETGSPYIRISEIKGTLIK